MNSGELKFPLTCQYRIIAEKREGMHFVIETVLMEHGVSAPLLHSHESSQGRYQSFQVEIIVNSLEKMNAIDAALRTIEGVKMVL
jgi:putative lipoic acid-binding regulatory protein